MLLLCLHVCLVYTLSLQIRAAVSRDELPVIGLLVCFLPFFYSQMFTSRLNMGSPESCKSKLCGDFQALFLLFTFVGVNKRMRPFICHATFYYLGGLSKEKQRH